MRWRLVDTDLVDSSLTAALDEAIARARLQNKILNTLHFFRRKPTVSLGYFQKVEKNVDLEVCRKYDIAIIRRMSGGSATYNDEGQLIYSFASKGCLPAEITKSYEMVCSALIEGLRILGLNAQFKPINDIQIGGRKVSGSAQWRRGDMVLQHGTLLIDTNVERMFQVLKIPKKKYEAKGLKHPSERVTTLTRELGSRPSMAKVKLALVEGFEKVFGVKIEREELSEFERKLAQKLLQEKYGRKEWNFRR